jgi:hypothetical protein
MKVFYSQRSLFFVLEILFFFLLLPLSCFSAPPQVCNLSQTNLFFVGREEELQKIASFFKKKIKLS